MIILQCFKFLLWLPAKIFQWHEKSIALHLAHDRTLHYPGLSLYSIHSKPFLLSSISFCRGRLGFLSAYSLVRYGDGVESASSSDALGSWFEPYSISKKPTLLPRCHEVPSKLGAILTSDLLEDQGWVKQKRSNRSGLVIPICPLYF